MKNLTCDVCGTNNMVNSYHIGESPLFSVDPLCYVDSDGIRWILSPEVEVCNQCVVQVRERYKKFLVENNLKKGK